MRRTKKSKVIGYRLLTAFFIALACSRIAFTQEEGKEKELVFGFSGNPIVTQTSIGGKGSADVRELFQMGSDAFKKSHGINFSLKIFLSPKFLFKALQDGTVDFSPMYTALYLYARRTGIPVKPLFSYGKSRTSNEKRCLYVHKGSNIHNIKQLEGKTFVFEFPVFLSKKDALPPPEGYILWVIAKKMLAKNGINKPFKKFFKEIAVLPVPWDSVAYSVLLKKFDACLGSEGFFESIKNYEKAFSDLVPLVCMETHAMGPVVYHQNTTPDIVKKVKDFFLSPPITKETQNIQKLYKNIKLYPVTEKDYDIYFQWLKEAEEKGWIAEFNEIMKKVPRPKSKKGE